MVERGVVLFIIRRLFIYCLFALLLLKGLTVGGCIGMEGLVEDLFIDEGEDHEKDSSDLLLPEDGEKRAYEVGEATEEDVGEDAKEGAEECAEEDAAIGHNRRWVRVYYLDEEQRFLVPVTIAIPWTEGIARATLEQIIFYPQRKEDLLKYGLKAPLPKGTAIIGLMITDKLAKVDFSAAFLDHCPEKEKSVLNSVLLTLTEFDTIERVKLMVEGFELSEFPGGALVMDYFGPERWVNLEVEADVEEHCHSSTVSLYFCYLSPKGVIFYVPVTRVIPQHECLLRATINELLDGPRHGSGLFSELPPDLTLLDIELVDGLLVVDLSEELLNHRGGRTGEENVVQQLTLTLTALLEVEQLKILVEGSGRIL